MERRPYTPEDAAIPEPLTINFDSIPHRLQEYDHFVVWKYERVDDELKKPPIDPKSGRRASVTRPETWGSFQEVQAAYETGQFAGVGIVLTSDMRIVGIDIDHCIVDGQADEEAHRIITAIDSYTEVSPSGTGVHIMLEGKLPGAFRRRGNIEMYEDTRYLTLTGHWIANTPMDIQPRHTELSGLYHRIFQVDSRETDRENTVGGVGRHPPFAYQISRSDEAVLQKALAAKNGDTFRRYYFGDTSLWEGAGAERDSQSAADFTLTLMLLYWTNNDMAQVDRLFRQSGLMRPKWDRPIKGTETYGERIISELIQLGGNLFSIGDTVCTMASVAEIVYLLRR